MWRRILINENMMIAQLNCTISIIFQANESYLFNIEKSLKKVKKHFMRCQTLI